MGECGATFVGVRPMTAPDLERLGDIDRSEHVTREYAIRDGRLVVEVVDLHVPRWPPTGGAWSVEARVERLAALLAEGGEVLGAFGGNRLVGIAGLRHRLTPTMAQLVMLFVSRQRRRQGIATRLLAEVVSRAAAGGAQALYVSSAPTGSAVGFYTRCGFRVTDEPHPALLALEPQDIHMVRALPAGEPMGRPGSPWNGRTR